MNFSGTHPKRKSLAEALQYERVAIFEAVLTLRDKRMQTRTKIACWSLAMIAAGTAFVVFAGQAIR